ncbi:MAG TPA: AcvB/VirJ family lysyl-phosphatidylglycerol hydrolase [Rhodanobacter sp.]
MLAIAGAGLIGIAMIWSPWSRVSMENATVVLPVSRISTAPPAGKDDVMAIIFSGDGGWADLDRRLGIAFIDRGIPVLGVNTFKYYWRNRTPEESAQQLDALMTKYAGAWGRQRIWLVGYSFGADVLPSLIDKLSPQNRTRITQMVLLAPSKEANFEIALEGYMIKQGWFQEHLKTLLEHINPIRDYDAMPPLQALDNRPPVVCYYGLDDADDTVCTEPNLPKWVTVHPKKGDHHFDGGYQPLAAQMLDELPARAASVRATP